LALNNVETRFSCGKVSEKQALPEGRLAAGKKLRGVHSTRAMAGNEANGEQLKWNGE